MPGFEGKRGKTKIKTTAKKCGARSNARLQPIGPGLIGCWVFSVFISRKLAFPRDGTLESDELHTLFTRDNFPNDRRVRSSFTKLAQSFIRFFGANNKNHAQTHIEGAISVFFGNIAFFDEPIHHRKHFPRAFFETNTTTLRKDPGWVIDEPTARNMGHG